MTEENPSALGTGEQYAILAASLAADMPKLVLKHGEGFFVADRRGDFLAIPASELGFYFEGTRFLSQLELRFHGRQLLLLNAAVSEDNLQIAVDLTNPDLQTAHGDLLLHGRTMRVHRALTLDGPALYQTISVESFGPDAYEVLLEWDFAADFADVFEVRGFVRAARGSVLASRLADAEVELGYRGLDGVVRTTQLRFDPVPDDLTASAARYRRLLPPGGRLDLAVTVAAAPAPEEPSRGPARGDVLARRRAERDQMVTGTARVETDHEYVNRWLARAHADLGMLLTATADGPLPYAGIPWYVAPFGRDSLITSLQVLPFLPEVARGTLRFLARHQARIYDDFTDQEPGKILHEYRRGELAACREIVFTPYYGTVDATPLFVMLAAEYLRWSGDLALARGLWPAVERALGWIRETGASGPDGYLTYRCRSPRGLGNQGWKDSHDAVMHASGALAPPPIALFEAQAYKYAALLGAADMAETIDAPVPALRQEALRLREAVERDFWLNDEGVYALALDGEGQPCRVVTSNPGHGLWTGLVPESRAEALAKRLLAADVFTGWGLRTLAARERRYNPMSYHNGSVWPHDTAIAAAGFRRYGLTESFVTVATGLFDAVLSFEGLRMPELFCGFPRSQGYGPTRYPVACAPQAWAAGVVFQLVASTLGLEPDARENRLTLKEPVLPPWLTWIEVRGLRVRHSSVDLLVSRGRHGAGMELLGRRGDVEVLVRR
jgi:glycogen debranching enzyme